MTHLHTGTVTRATSYRIRTSPPCARRPQRETMRHQMYGRKFANDNRESRAWFWIQFGIYAACTAYALDLWIVR